MHPTLSGLEPWLSPYAQYLHDAALASGLAPRVTSGRRTRAQQEILYQRHLRGLSNFPAAPPGRSKHEEGRAFDMTVVPMSALPAVGAFWQQMGGRWFASDPIHFEV